MAPNYRLEIERKKEELADELSVYTVNFGL